MLSIYLLAAVQVAYLTRDQHSIEEDLVNELAARIGDILDPTMTPDPPDELRVVDPDEIITIPKAQTVFKDPNGDWYYLYIHNATINGSADLKDSIDTIRSENEVYLTSKIKRLVIRGNCTLQKTTSPTLSERITQGEIGGTFVVEIANVTVEGTAYLITKPNGHFMATEVFPNVTYDDSHVSMRYEILPKMINFTAGKILPILKPYLEENCHVRLTNVAAQRANTDSASIPMKRDVLRIDSTIFKARKYVNQLYEPYQIPFFNLVDFPKSTKIGPIELRGLSNFQLAGNVTVNVLDCATVRIGVDVVTGLIRGRCPLIVSDESNRSESKDLAHFTLQQMTFTAALDLPIGDAHPHPILSELAAHGPPDLDEAFEIRLDSGGDVQEFRFVLFSGIKNWLAKRIQENVRTEILSKLDNKQFQRRIVDVREAANATRCGKTQRR